MSFTFDEDGFAKLINRKPFDWKKLIKRAFIVGLLVFLGYCAGRVNGRSEADKSTQALMTEYDKTICSYERLVQEYEARERNNLPPVGTWSDIHVPAK